MSRAAALEEAFDGFVVRVRCSGCVCVAERVDDGVTTPVWTHTLKATDYDGHKEAKATFDRSAGTVTLHVVSLGGSGHDPWAEETHVLRLTDGHVLDRIASGG